MQSVIENFEEWAHLRHHHASAETPAATATIGTSTPTEVPDMSLLTELEADAKNLAAKFEAVDHAAVAKLEAIQATPGAMQVIDALAGVLHLPPSALQVATDSLISLGNLFPKPAAAEPQPAPSFTPAGPQVAGQA